MSAKLFVIAAVLLSVALRAAASPAPSFQQGAKLVGTGAVGSSQQGHSVALSGDGNTAIVGGTVDNTSAGAVWTYARSGGVWSQLGTKLVGTGGVGTGTQGTSVALSGDGNTAIEGASVDNSNAGAVWYFTRSSGVWSQQGPKFVGTGAVGSAQQGFSVAISADGNTAIVGGPVDNGGLGAAWVYTRSGGVWSQQGTKLVGTAAVGNAVQGRSVALSADGNTAVLGANADNGFAGAFWVFTRSAGIWSQQGAKLIGSGAVGNAQQGNSVSISADGNTVLVGGPADNVSAGAAWVFTRAGSIWSQQGTKLIGSGGVGNSQRGIAVSLSADGNTAIVGGNGDNNFGAVWVFTRSSGAWSQQGSKLAGTGAVGTPSQGQSVSISADGSTALIGGPLDNAAAGAVWVMIDPAPKIAAIGDIPNDQGGKVSVRWSASLLDNGPTNPIGAYWIWRQAPIARAAGGSAERSTQRSPETLGVAPAGRKLRVTRDGTQVYYWEYIGSQVSHGLPGYSYSAPTASDSVAGSNPQTLFMVEAEQLTTGLAWPSDPDSAYSVDNLPPKAPALLLGSYSGGATTLHWRKNVEPDLSHYNIYRGASAAFVPSPGNLIASLPDTAYADAIIGGHFYKLSAVDIHGNESAFNLLTPLQVGGVPGGAGSGVWLGRAAPNPARSSSVVRYGLPIAGLAELSVFDAQGGMVRHLVRGSQGAGEAQATWDGRDDRGTSVAGGIYFVRLATSGSAPLTQRMVWIR